MYPLRISFDPLQVHRLSYQTPLLIPPPRVRPCIHTEKGSGPSEGPGAVQSTPPSSTDPPPLLRPVQTISQDYLGSLLPECG